MLVRSKINHAGGVARRETSARRNSLLKTRGEVVSRKSDISLYFVPIKIDRLTRTRTPRVTIQWSINLSTQSAVLIESRRTFFHSATKEYSQVIEKLVASYARHFRLNERACVSRAL